MLAQAGFPFVATVNVGQPDPQDNPVTVVWYQLAPHILIELTNFEQGC